jgi:hypothetical protein
VPGTRQGQGWELKMVLMLFLIFKLCVKRFTSRHFYF